MKRKTNLLFLPISVVIIGFVFLLTNLDKEQKYKPRADKDHFSRGIKGAVEWMIMVKNNPETGELDPALVLKAREQVRLFREKQLKSLGLTWENMGPDNIGGRTRAILIDKDNPTTLYAGGVSGGLWKSTTGGSSWVQITSVSENLAVSSITQTANGDIFVGTGEGLAAPSGTVANTGTIGYGVYKSTDGTNFSLIPSTIPVPNNNSTEWAMVNRLASDPTNSDRVYAATNRGLYITNNATGDVSNISWKVAKYQINSSTYTNMVGEASDVKVGSDGSVVAAVNTRCYTSNSGDDSTYILRSGSSSGLLPNSGLSRIELAIAPSNTDIIYCVAAKTNGSLHNIYRSNDKGVSWYIIAPGGSSNFNLFGDNNQGWYDNVVAVFPNNPDKLLVGGIDMWEGYKVTPTGFFNWTQVSYSTYVHVDHHAYVFHPTNPNVAYFGTDGGIFMTNDGANSFQSMNKNYTTTQFYAVAVSGQGQVMGGTQDNSTPYISLFGNTPEEAEELWYGDGGWASFSLINQEAFFVTSQFAILGRSPDKGSTWQTYVDFFDNRMLNNNDEPNFNASFVTPLLLWESFGDPLSKDSVEHIVKDSVINAGTTFQVASYNNSYPFDYTTNTTLYMDDTIKVLDPIQSKFFLGVQGGVWMTKEALDFSKRPTWFKLANLSGTVQSMAYSQDGNHLFVGTQGGTLYRISGIQDGYDSTTLDVTSAQTMIQTDQINTFGRIITSIAVDPADANRVVVTLGSYGNYSSWVYFSSDALGTSPSFNSRNGSGLPSMPVYSSLILLNNPNTVLIGTEYGMYATENINTNLPTWTAENNGMDLVPCYMIRQQTSQNPGATSFGVDNGDTIYTYYPGVSNYGEIYVATHGRGFYKSMDYVGIGELPTNNTMYKPGIKVYPNPAYDITTIDYTLGNVAMVSIQVYDLNGKIVKSYDLNRKASGKYSFNMNIADLPKGTYIVNLLAGNKSSTSKLLKY